jgi:hypothetical protein
LDRRSKEIRVKNVDGQLTQGGAALAEPVATEND